MKKLAYIALAASLIASVLLFQNCNGVRIRTADFSVSSAKVQEYLKYIKDNTLTSSSTADASAVAAFFDLADQAGTTIYYSEAPSTMGKLDTVMPLQFSNFNVTTVPTKAAAYLAFGIASDGPHAALLVTSITKDDNGVFNEVPLIALASSQAGTMTDTDIDLPMVFNGNTNLILRSQDVVDGDLASVIQFEIIEPTQEGNDFTWGLVNLVQPD